MTVILHPMVKNPALLERFELELLRRTPIDYRQNFRLVEALYQEARHLGTFDRKDPLDGLDTVIALARAINRV